MICVASLTAQKNTLPDVNLKTLQGKSVSASQISNGGNPIVIIYWSTSCHHTINGLEEIADVYSDWQEETKVKVIAMSSDDKRSSGKVPAFYNAKGWEFECYLDENGDFKRAMNVINAPHIMVLDGNLNIIFNKSSYGIGDEDLIYEKLTNR